MSIIKAFHSAVTARIACVENDSFIFCYLILEFCFLFCSPINFGLEEELVVQKFPYASFIDSDQCDKTNVFFVKHFQIPKRLKNLNLTLTLFKVKKKKELTSHKYYAVVYKSVNTKYVDQVYSQFYAEIQIVIYDEVLVYLV